MYYSAYGPERLDAIAQTLRRSEAAERGCIFDNTASGSAAGDALYLANAVGVSRPCTPG